MKKLITGVLALLIILLIVWAGMTWYIGNQAETELRDSVAQADQRMNHMLRNNLPADIHQDRDLVEITVSDYQKGFLGSNALISIKPNEALRTTDSTDSTTTAASSESLEVKTAISHGPVLWRPSDDGNSAFGLAEAYATLSTTNLSADVQQQLEQMFAGKEPFIGQFTQGFGQSGTFDVLVNPINITDGASGVSFNLGAINLQGNASQNGSGDQAEYTIPADYEVGALTINSPAEGIKIDMAGISGTTKSRVDAQGTVTHSQSNAIIPSVSLNLPDLPEAVTFAANLTSRSETDAAGVAQGGYQVQIKDLVTPMLPTSSLDWKVDFAGINIKAIETIQGKLQRLGQSNPGAAQLSEAEADEVISAVFSDVLAAERSQVKQALLLENKLGQGVLDINLEYKGTQGQSLDSVAAAKRLMPQDWLQMLDGRIDFHFDHDLFPMASLFLGNQPFIVKNDKNQYAMQLTLQGDEFVLNEERLSFEEFGGLVGMTMMGGMGSGMAPPAVNPSAPPQTGSDLTEEEAAELQQLMDEMEGMQMEPAQ